MDIALDAGILCWRGLCCEGICPNQVSEDDSKIPVIMVSNQEIILEGGVSLEKEKISDYIVVSHDSGVFYIPSEKALTVEWDISSLVRTIVEYSVICSCCIVLLVALRSR